MASTKCCRCACGCISPISIPLVEMRQQKKIGFITHDLLRARGRTQVIHSRCAWHVRPTNELPYTKERKARYECVNMPMRNREGLARREGWSSASLDRRAKCSVKRIKGRAGKGIGKNNGAAVFVGFGEEVELEGVGNGDGG